MRDYPHNTTLVPKNYPHNTKNPLIYSHNILKPLKLASLAYMRINVNKHQIRDQRHWNLLLRIVSM